MKESLRGVDIVQENGPERVDLKLKLFKDIPEAVGPDVIIASSSFLETEYGRESDRIMTVMLIPGARAAYKCCLSTNSSLANPSLQPVEAAG